MGKRKTSETSHPKIDGEAKTKKSYSYAFRPSNQRASCIEASNPEALEDEMAGSDRALNTENTNLHRSAPDPVDSAAELNGGNEKTYTPGTEETAMVHSSANLTEGSARGCGQGRSNRLSEHDAGREGMDTRWGVRGRRSRTSRRRAAEGEESNPGQSLTMEKGTLSNEARSAEMKRVSSSCPPEPEQMRLSCKKTILSWLIEHNLIDEGEQVYYLDNPESIVTMTGRVTTGRITGGGIICSCCRKVTSVWTFEKHAGSNLRQPYKYIYLPNKATYLQDLQITAWQGADERKRRTMFSYVPKKNSADQNDNACSICGDGGDLMCCDKCPSMYHPSCMNMERVPHTDWLCPYCICKFCGLGVESKTFITCSQCDKKFHFSCVKNLEKDFLRENFDSNRSRLYCGPGCKEIYEKLEGSLGITNDTSKSYSWRVVCQMDMTTWDVAARNLRIENNSKVAVAWMLMNEAFETVTDRCTGINVVQNIVYSCGSNLNRVNFSRFYTFVFEKDDEIIAAASVRCHGREFAEMPFIATDEAYREQGICKLLMRVIESFLCDLEVEKLIIPSTPDTAGMWKRKYSFNVVNKELKRTISSYNILMLPRAIQLYKDLSKGIADGGHGGDNEPDQTDIQNGLVPQLAEVERPPQTDNQDGLEPQPSQAAKPAFLFDLNLSDN